MLKRWSVVVAAVAVLALLAAGVLWWRAARTTELERAVGLAPAGADRLSWTDWAAVRSELGADLSASSSQRASWTEFLDEGFDADLTSTSALLESATVLHERFGFSPATIDWELFSQSAEGAEITLRLPESADFDELADALEELGYARPDDEDGVWRGGSNLLAEIGPDLTPGAAVHRPRRRRAPGADVGQRGVPRAGPRRATASRSKGSTRWSRRRASRCPRRSTRGPTPARCWRCRRPDAGDQDQADELIAEAGEVNPVTGFAMSAQPGGDVRVVLSFENDDQARTNADSRSALARGPAPGQGGDFADRFRVGPVTAEGTRGDDGAGRPRRASSCCRT